MTYVAFNQEVQKELLDLVGASFMTGPLSFVGEAYVNAQVLTAIAATFFVNFFIGSFGTLTLAIASIYEVIEVVLMAKLIQ